MLPKKLVWGFEVLLKRTLIGRKSKKWCYTENIIYELRMFSARDMLSLTE
jgi:hypothetical protein